MITIYRRIPFCSAYAISEKGVVISMFSNKEIKAHCNKRGYLKVQLYINGKRKNFYVHLLVLETYKGPRPESYHGCHKDDDPLNNNLSNLKWDTPEKNYAQKRKPASGEEIYTAKLSNRKIKEIRRLSGIGVTNRQIGKIFDVAHSTIGNILNGKTWSHVI